MFFCCRNLVISDMMMDDHSRTDDMDDMPETLTYSNSGGRRNRSNAAADAGRVQIPKQVTQKTLVITFHWCQKEKKRKKKEKKGKRGGKRKKRKKRKKKKTRNYEY